MYVYSVCPFTGTDHLGQRLEGRRNIAVRSSAGDVKSSKTAVESSQLPVRWVPGAFLPGVKQKERETSRLTHGPYIWPLIIAYLLAGMYRCTQGRTTGRSTRAPNSKGRQDVTGIIRNVLPVKSGVHPRNNFIRKLFPIRQKGLPALS
jgi:hypothetical protein